VVKKRLTRKNKKEIHKVRKEEMKQLNNGIKMKNKAITPLLIILLSILNYAQNTYNVQPGVKNNQIVLELKNISKTETVQIKSLPKLSKGGAYERIKLTNEKEKFVELLPEETKEIVYTFDVDYNIGTTKSDTIEFTITDGNAVNITKQFILQYTIPAEYKLEQNYPNPFNPTTKIRYSIANVGSGLALTELKVFDILGNEIATLVDEQKEVGYYEVEFAATQLASGVYFYRLQAGNFIQTKKMLLLK
jgi:hypothetical protein